MRMQAYTESRSSIDLVYCIIQRHYTESE